MEDLYVSYKDQVEFLIVYIREAHPEMLKEGHQTGVVGRPKDIDERVILATKCATEFQFTIPTLIDGMEGHVNADYKAAPVRVAITDLDGKIVYYAGRGPRDFRLSAVEHVLKRLVANKGHIPAPPEPQWGKPINGLRCGISFDPPSPRIGEDVVVHTQFSNTTENALGLLLTNDHVQQNLGLTDTSDQHLTIKLSGAESSQSKRSNQNKRRRRRHVHEIKPGDSVFCDIYGTLETASQAAQAGDYYYQFSMALDSDTTAELAAEKEDGYDFPLWTGRVNSGAAIVKVGKPIAKACIDCHGKKDYHHQKSHGCEDCHVGQVGEDDFDTKPEACSQCHPRPGKQGRRLILGRDGEFNQASRHVYGSIDDGDCLKCHDASGHRNGVVSLIDPTEDGGKPWTGTARDFCLTCHTAKPPEGVSYPIEAKGSGYDKSLAIHGTHAKWLGPSSCTHCHTSHGSPDHALLRAPFVMDANETTGAADVDYGLCWTCHDQDRILTEANAFDRLHGLHVEDEDVVCAACHDVHGAKDQGQVGLIKFRTKVQTERSEYSTFQLDLEHNQGSCAMSCHSDNKPRSYAREHKRHTVTCLNCH
jgi:hypothetical protein